MCVRNIVEFLLSKLLSFSFKTFFVKHLFFSPLIISHVSLPSLSFPILSILALFDSLSLWVFPFNMLSCSFFLSLSLSLLNFLSLSLFSLFICLFLSCCSLSFTALLSPYFPLFPFLSIHVLYLSHPLSVYFFSLAVSFFSLSNFYEYANFALFKNLYSKDYL